MGYGLAGGGGTFKPPGGSGFGWVGAIAPTPLNPGAEGAGGSEKPIFAHVPVGTGPKTDPPRGVPAMG